MTRSNQVTRDICIVGIDGVYRSTAASLSGERRPLIVPMTLQRDFLYRFDGDEVLLTTRHGQSVLGRLRVTEHKVELWQMVAHIPCRHRLDVEDIVACCIYGTDDAFWDMPTRPERPGGTPGPP